MKIASQFVSMILQLLKALWFRRHLPDKVFTHTHTRTHTQKDTVIPVYLANFVMGSNKHTHTHIHANTHTYMQIHMYALTDTQTPWR